MAFDKGFSSALQQMARKVTFFPPPSGQTWESMAASGAAFVLRGKAEATSGSVTCLTAPRCGILELSLCLSSRSLHRHVQRRSASQGCLSPWIQR